MEGDVDFADALVHCLRLPPGEAVHDVDVGHVGRGVHPLVAPQTCLVLPSSGLDAVCARGFLSAGVGRIQVFSAQLESRIFELGQTALEKTE